MEGVGELREWIGWVRCRMAEPVMLRRNSRHGIIRKRTGTPRCTMLQPQLIEGNAVERSSNLPELVEIALLLLRPADEFDPELVGGMGLTEEFGLVDAELKVEFQDRRYGAFADADGADRLGLNDHDALAARSNEACERRRSHPACGASSNDDDSLIGPPWFMPVR